MSDVKEKTRAMTRELSSTRGGTGSGLFAPGQKPKYSEGLETDETRALENQEILRLQHRKLEDQDSLLDQLEQGAVRTKEIGKDIGNELTLHDKLLHDIDNDMDKTSGKMKRETRRLNKLLKNQKSCCALMVMVFLIAIIVALYLTHWGCDIFKSKSRCK